MKRESIELLKPIHIRLASMKGKFGQRDFCKNGEFQRKRYQILQTMK